MSRKSNMGSKLFMGKSSVKHIREDMRVNDILACEKHLRKKVVSGIKESDGGTGVISLKVQKVRKFPLTKFREPKIAPIFVGHSRKTNLRR